MRKIASIIFIIVVLSFLFSGCGNSNEKKDQQLVKAFLKEKGYSIVCIDEKSSTYTLKKVDLLKLPYQMYWGVQTVDAGNYIGKIIKTYRTIVKNHPLDKARNNNKGQTVVWVMVCEDRVVGGYALPDYDEMVSGGVYSLEGKTLEEVTGMTLHDWVEMWNKKYM
jgi:hypothetical protein